MDIEIILFFQNLRGILGNCLNDFFAFITTIAVDYYILIPALILFWAVDKKAGILGIASYGVGCFYNAILKSTFAVYRPWIKNNKIKPLESVMKGASGYSFPSGHSTSVSSFYSALIFYYRKHKKLCVVFALMIFLTMFSRLYVGVHTPQDVLVGALLGILAIATVSVVSKFVSKKPNNDVIVLIVGIIACIVALIYIYTKNYPMDYIDGKLIVDPVTMTVNGFKDPGMFFGALLGWFVERRYVKFEICKSPVKKVERCFIGAILVILYWTAIVDPVGNFFKINIVYFLLRASIPFIFMVIYPLTFRSNKK